MKSIRPILILTALLLMIGLLFAGILWLLPYVKSMDKSPGQAAAEWIVNLSQRGLSREDYLWLVLVNVLSVLSGIIPLSLIALAIGSVAGIKAGFLTSTAGITIGAVLAFLFSRYLIRKPLQKWIGSKVSIQNLDDSIARQSWRFILAMRLSPVAPFSVISYAFGLTKVRFRDYLIGIIGALPGLFSCVYSGSLTKDIFLITQGKYTDNGWVHISILALGLIATIITIAFTVKIVQNSRNSMIKTETPPI